ncbi:hypothetical protein [Oceanospirillum sp.]|uniref:hypothetical protein n=1 Tax=Oceanospirillum sp. TaxID=2021254 RepID=UPI003A92D49C
MKLRVGKRLPLALIFAILAGCASDNIQEIEAGYDEDGGAGPVAMSYIDDVATDIRGQQGLLAIARSDAELIHTHASLAMQRAQDSDWVKMHAIHIRHTLAPASAESGAVSSYGLLKAVNHVKDRVELAMEQNDASDAIEFHGEQITLSADSVLERGQQLLALADQIIHTPRYSDLSGEAPKLVLLAEQILSGEDLNGDGEISWEDNEPGLDQAMKYLDYLKEKERAYGQ